MRDPETVIWDRAGQGAVLRGQARMGCRGWCWARSEGRLVQVGQNVLCLLGDERPVEGTVPSRGRPKANSLKALCSFTKGLPTSPLPPAPYNRISVLWGGSSGFR